MSSDLLIGLAGGAIGAVVAGAFVQAGRAWLAWGEVTLHDFEASERNRRLRIWVDDRTRELAQEISGISNRLASDGLLYSGAHGAAVTGAKAKALHQYRDEEEATTIDLMTLRASEGAWHSFWRVLRRRGAPTLTAGAEVEPFLDRWREPVSRHGSDAVTPLDRTRRTFDDALAELPRLDLI
ncbi:MAG TPA: hypothetical protein VGC63_13135 [Solirubrobacterales bacterium]|jgi:hypothetical protein